MHLFYNQLRCWFHEKLFFLSTWRQRLWFLKGLKKQREQKVNKRCHGVLAINLRRKTEKAENKSLKLRARCFDNVDVTKKSLLKIILLLLLAIILTRKAAIKTIIVCRSNFLARPCFFSEQVLQAIIRYSRICTYQHFSSYVRNSIDNSTYYGST